MKIKVQAVGQRIDKELGEEQAFFIDGCENDWEKLPRPDMPLTVGIDAGSKSYEIRPVRRPAGKVLSSGHTHAGAGWEKIKKAVPPTTSDNVSFVTF